MIQIEGMVVSFGFGIFEFLCKKILSHFFGVVEIHDGIHFLLFNRQKGVVINLEFPAMKGQSMMEHVLFAPKIPIKVGGWIPKGILLWARFKINVETRAFFINKITDAERNGRRKFVRGF